MTHLGLCSKCGGDNNRLGQRYCLGCHNAYMREWRKTHPLSAEQKLKDTCRSYANVYKRRGKILIQESCGICGGKQPQMHHEDYSEPLNVQWLCRPCHQSLHSHGIAAIVSIPI